MECECVQQPLHGGIAGIACVAGTAMLPPLLYRSEWPSALLVSHPRKLQWQQMEGFFETGTRIINLGSLNPSQAEILHAVDDEGTGEDLGEYPATEAIYPFAHVPPLLSWGGRSACERGSVSCGWPARCLAADWYSLSDSSWSVRGGLLRDEQSFLPAFGVRQRLLPLTPMWIGLVIDWAFWMAVFAAFFTAIRWSVEQSRCKRGLCRRCAYSLAGLLIRPLRLPGVWPAALTHAALGGRPLTPPGRNHILEPRRTARPRDPAAPVRSAAAISRTPSERGEGEPCGSAINSPVKPHPRIRKTIKWGGLAATVLTCGGVDRERADHVAAMGQNPPPRDWLQGGSTIIAGSLDRSCGRAVLSR